MEPRRPTAQRPGGLFSRGVFFIVGDTGLYCYNPGLSTLFITDISIQCSDDANTIIIYIVGTGLWTRFAGVCSIINASSVKKCGIDISHGFCALGSDSANNTIGFKGNFTHVLYGTSHSTWNIAYGENKTQKMFFDGIADNLIYMIGCSSLYMYQTTAPEFRNGFKGNIRARAGSTIGIITLQPSQWLPAGSQWVKDDTSHITGQ